MIATREQFNAVMNTPCTCSLDTVCEGCEWLTVLEKYNIPIEEES